MNILFALLIIVGILIAWQVKEKKAEKRREDIGETGAVAQLNADKRKPSVAKGCLIGLIVGIAYCILKLIFIGKV